MAIVRPLIFFSEYFSVNYSIFSNVINHRFI